MRSRSGDGAGRPLSGRPVAAAALRRTLRWVAALIALSAISAPAALADGEAGGPAVTADPAAPAQPPAPAPAEPTPVEPAPAEPVPSEPAPSEPAPSEPAPTEPAPSQPAPSQPAPSEPAPSHGAPSEPATSDPSAPAAPATGERGSPPAPDAGNDTEAPGLDEPGPEAEESHGTLAGGQNRSLVFQVVWQVQRGCQSYCHGTSQSQSAVQWSSTTQSATAISRGDETSASGSAAHARNESLTVQFAWQMQIGCVAFCYETSQAQTASQLAQTAQTAVAEADLEAWAENLSETLQYVWQLQEGCAYECYGVYQSQSSEQGQSTSQSAKATARDEDDGTMLALGPDGVIVLPGWLVALANNVGATIQTIYQYQEASCLERCDGGAQVQEAVQRAIVEQVATAIVLAGQPAPPSEPPPGGTAPPAPQAPGPATPAPAQPAAATRAPADGAPVNLRQARLVAEALIADLQKGNLAARPDGRSLVAGPPASLSGGLPPAEVASSAPHGEPADRNVAGGRGSRPAHGSDAGPGSFLGVEFHPAPETLGEDDGRDWTSLILLALFAGLALVAVGPRAPRAG